MKDKKLVRSFSPPPPLPNSGSPLHSQHPQQGVPARRVVCAVPAENSIKLFPEHIKYRERVAKYIERDKEKMGGGIVLFLGVPDEEVASTAAPSGSDDEHPGWTHHQILQDHHQPLGDGNNMFVSVSSPSDLGRESKNALSLYLSLSLSLYPPLSFSFSLSLSPLFSLSSLTLPFVRECT